MAVERPTFSESWYRVNDLCPRLRSTTQVYRQHYRGRMWHVIHDPSSNQFFRLNDAAYTFVGLLDGRRTVAEVWRICNEELGDAAPTQGEAIQLLGQMYTSNLLAGDMPPDAEGLLNRYRRRVQREVTNYVKNFLFIRIPLLDPDRFLDWGLPLVGWIFSWVGFLLLLGMTAVGGYFVVTDFGRIIAEGKSVFNRMELMSNLPLLYASFVLVKVFHEFGHAFACKKFGRQGGTGGEVHVMGVMFLVFTPLPYVDASSAWAFRSKWHRVLVGMAGMLIELFLASLAAVIWYHTTGVVHAICYNVMFIASVSTLLFNGNPLLRYDAYYITSDLLEIPNLYQRAKEYIYYLVKKYAWNVRHPRNPAHSPGEKVWLTIYGIASSIYKVFIFSMILLFLTDRLPDSLFVVGVILGVAGAVVFLGVPVVKFIHYLATHNELMRVRARAVISTVVVVGTVVTVLGFLPCADRFRVEGVVEPVRLAIVYAGSDGFVTDYLPSGRAVRAGDMLIQAENEELRSQERQLLATRVGLEARRRQATTREIAAAQAYAQQIAAVDEQIARVRRLLAALTVRAPFDGTWVAPEIEQYKGAFLRRGDRVGVLATMDQVIIKAVADQKIAGILLEQAVLAEARQRRMMQGRLLTSLPGCAGGGASMPAAAAAAVIDAARIADDELYRRVEIRVKGRPATHLYGRKLAILSAARKVLPSPALGAVADGPVVTAPDDRRGVQAAEGFFPVHVAPEPTERLLGQQRVVIRLDMPKRPLVLQWWRSLRQLFQRRFRV
ncbi:MAG: hypothetical protein ACYS5V_00350 [Planctomycetota bacterium]|jgi:putative peptide zinc metalloprotease protein